MDLAKLVFDILASVGTVTATILALWLAASDQVRRVDAVFVWGGPTDYQPLLFIKNIRNRSIVIERIIIKYNHRNVCEIDMFGPHKFHKYAILKPNEEISMSLDAKLFSFKPLKNDRKSRWLKIIIVPRQGRRFVSKQRFSYRDLEELLFGNALFS